MSRLAYRHASEKGVDADALLRQAGLSPADIANPHTPISVRGQITFVELVAEKLKDPELGFHLASDFDLRRLEFLYYVATSADTLGVALQRLERYCALVSEGVIITLRKAKTIRATYEYIGIARHTDRQQIEFFITVSIRLCRHLINQEIKPLRVRLAHRRHVAKDGLAKLAGIKIENGARIDEVEFPGHIWDMPLATTDHHLHDMLVRYCEDALAKRAVKRSAMRARVENTVADLLPHGQAQASVVATQLGMSPRTLARRLESEGLSFAGIMRDLRLALAQRFLADPDLPISQVAWLLGYKEIGSFTHAFRRWTGKTPSEARQAALGTGK